MKDRACTVAAIVSPLMLRRLEPGLADFVDRRLSFHPIDWNQPVNRLISDLVRLQPDAILAEYDAGHIESLLSMRKPMVVLMADLLISGTVCINIDDHRLGYIAAGHLHSRGIRHFAWYGRDFQHAPERLRGFTDFLAERGLIAQIRHEPEQDFRQDHGTAWKSPDSDLIEWLGNLERPVGVLAAHDSLGRTLAEACAEAGLDIPDDVAVLSASDDGAVCALAHPPLSSIVIPWDALGRAAGRCLRSLLAGEPPPDDPLLIAPIQVRTRKSSDVIAQTHPLVAKALRHARDHLMELRDVAQWAREVGTHRRGLERAFQQELRKSPLEMLQRLRVTRARELLLQTDRPLSWIAEQCGFSQQEKLSTHFKRIMHIPPSVFRRNHR